MPRPNKKKGLLSSASKKRAPPPQPKTTAAAAANHKRTTAAATATATTLTPPGYGVLQKSKIAARLKELEDEKLKLAERILQIKIRKEKEKERQEKSNKYKLDPSNTAAYKLDNNDYDDEGTISEDASSESSSRPLPQGGKRRRQRGQKKRRGGGGGRSQANSADMQQSDVSSLNSRAASYYQEQQQQHQGSDEDHEDYDTEDDENDNVSFMTENIYHYDVRGRRVTDEDYVIDDTDSVAACFQNVTGKNNIVNQESKDKYSTKKTKKKSKKKTKSKTNNSNEDEEDQARVVIEWKRGKSYRPEANLVFDEYVYNNHPTELSLMVADDKSFYDEYLSFSSGDDSMLAAAVPDMPMNIDVSGNGSDNESVCSGLHSECSISVAGPLHQQEGGAVSSKSAKLLNNKGLPPAAELQGVPLYKWDQFENNSDDDDDDDDDKDDRNQKSKKEKASRRRKRKGKDEPPPLTTDMSLIDDRSDGSDDNFDNNPDAKNRKQNNNKTRGADTSGDTNDPPFEISCGKSQASIHSGLGSEMGGASIALQDDSNKEKDSKSKKTSSGKTKSDTKDDDDNNKESSKKNKKKKGGKKNKEAPVAPAAPADNLLGNDTETEEYELSAGHLILDGSGYESVLNEKEARKSRPTQKRSSSDNANDRSPKSPKGSGGKSKAQTSPTTPHKAPKIARRATTEHANKKGPAGATLQRGQSDPSLGGATGMDTEGGVAPPKKDGGNNGKMDALPQKAKKGGVSSPKQSDRNKAGGANGMKKSDENHDCHNSKSTCNSSLTSKPDMNGRSLVIDGVNNVK